MNTMINIDVGRGVIDMTTKMMALKISDEEFILTTTEFLNKCQTLVLDVINENYSGKRRYKGKELEELFQPFDPSDYSENFADILTLFASSNFDWATLPIHSVKLESTNGRVIGVSHSLYIRF